MAARGNLIFLTSGRYCLRMPLIKQNIAFLIKDLKTPMSTTRSISATTNKFGDMTIGSPTPLKNMETSFTQSSDVELQVAKINAIFPTVSDTHIRLLLKK